MGRNHTRSADGFYHIHGKKYEFIRGSRAQVFHGTAYKTDGTPGLTKEKLLMNKYGRIVSAKKHATAKREAFSEARLDRQEGQVRRRSHLGPQEEPQAQEALSAFTNLSFCKK